MPLCCYLPVSVRLVPSFFHNRSSLHPQPLRFCQPLSLPALHSLSLYHFVPPALIPSLISQHNHLLAPCRHFQLLPSASPPEPSPPCPPPPLPPCRPAGALHSHLHFTGRPAVLAGEREGGSGVRWDVGFSCQGFCCLPARPHFTRQIFRLTWCTQPLLLSPTNDGECCALGLSANAHKWENTLLSIT